MTKRLPLLAMAALILVGACTDSRVTQPPQRPALTAPAKSISDGFHGGNPNFFFLVPTLPFTSSGNFKLGQFNPKLQPEVVICKLDPSSFSNGFPTDNSTCASTTADLTFASGAVHVVITPASTFENGLQRTFTLPADGFYYTVWNTQGAGLTKGSYYRISVQSNGGRLGFVDITPEPLGTGIFQLLNVVTHQVVPTLQNGTVPVVFRIQNGATCFPVTSCIETTVTNTGTDKVNGISGTLVTAPSGNNDGKDGAKAFFPNGFLTNVVDAAGNAITSVVVTIKQVTPSVAQDCHNPTANPLLLQFLNCYNFSVSPMPANAWGTPVTVTTCPVLVNTSTVGELTQLFASDNGGPARPLPPSILPLNCAGGTFDTPTGIGMMKSGNPMVRLAGTALNAVAKGFSRLFGPRELLAWDVGVGGFDAGPGFSNIGWGMLPTMTIQAPPTAAAGAIVAVSATVTTDHDVGSKSPELGVPVPGLTVSFSANGGALSATADGTGAGPTVSAVTNGSGTAVVYLTVSGNPANNVITSSIKDPSQINTVVTAQTTVVGSVVGQFIDFESGLDCGGSCSVSDQYQGVLFQYSYFDGEGTSTTSPLVVVVGNNHEATAPIVTAGAGPTPGTFLMQYSPGRTDVSFDVIGTPNQATPTVRVSVPGFDDTNAPPPTVTDNPATGARTWHYHIANTTGVTGVSIDMTQNIYFVDNIALNPGPFSP